MNRNFIWVLIFLAFNVRGQNIQIGPNGTWVKAFDRNITIPENEKIENGCFFTLVDRQFNVSLQQEYVHEILNLTNENGVQNNSQLKVNFDPSYQKIQFHHIRIIRNGKTYEQLKLNEFKVYRQETEVSSFLYNGNSTALFILNDVRVSDVIDYDYTVTGFNPVFKNKFYEQFYFEDDEPMGLIHYSVIMPENRRLNLKDFNSPPKVSIENLFDGSIKYDWTLKNVKAHTSEDFEPDWYDDYPCVQVTEAKSWKEIIDWTQSINPSVTNISPELKNQISKFKKESSTQAEYLQKCVRFVQDEVRYMGIETTEHSHKPHAPNQTFRQKYGDCKDKSLLLCAMLNANGIEANPALVSSDEDSTITKYLPSPLIFDHCITNVIFEGKEYWFDPTLSLKRGSILQQSTPDYKFALVIKNGGNGLSPIPFSYFRKTEITETFTMRSFEGKGTLKVLTKYYGGDADRIRNRIQDRSRLHLQNDFLEYYSKEYDSLKLADPIRINDNESDNIVEITESYSISKPWKKKGEKYLFEFNSTIISGRLDQLSSRERRSPVSINYPCDVTYNVVMELPDDWYVAEEKYNVMTDFLQFDYWVENFHSGVKLNYKLKTLKDCIPASMASEYNSKRDQILDYTGYELSWDQNASEDSDESSEISSASMNVNSRFIILSFLILGLCLLASRGIYRLKVITKGIHLYDSIGGILILPLAMLILTFFLILYTLMNGHFYDMDYLDNLYSKETGSYNWEKMIIVSMASNIVLLTLTGLCILSYIKRRDILPRLMICFYIMCILILVLNKSMTEITAIEPQFTINDFVAISACILSIPFFIFSNRVKDTFVIPYYND